MSGDDILDEVMLDWTWTSLVDSSSSGDAKMSVRVAPGEGLGKEVSAVTGALGW